MKIRHQGFPNESQPDGNGKRKKLRLIVRYMTIIEILVVVVIMTLLLSIATPAFTEMIKGVGVEAAARNISQALKLARVHAINNNRYVAVLMPSRLGTMGRPAQSFAQINDRYFNRSYRYCYVTKRAGGDFDFHSWLPNEGWQYLPDGTIFLELNTTKGVNPSGSILSPLEGDISKVYYVDYTDASGVKMAGDTNDETTAAIVFKPSGKMSGLVRYVEIGEGGYSGNTQVLTNKEAGAYVSVKVDQYTGRVSYGDE